MYILISPAKEMTQTAPYTKRKPELEVDAVNLGLATEELSDNNYYRAIDLYNGLQYRYLKKNLTEDDLQFLDRHLRILSAHYGVIRPFDSIQAYRKDFKLKGAYKAWEDRIYRHLTKETNLLLNLASQEFSKVVTRYQEDDIRIIDVDFYEKKEDGTLKSHSTISKKARGQFVNYLARTKVLTDNHLKAFNDMDYQFHFEESTDNHWIFIRTEDT